MPTKTDPKAYDFFACKACENTFANVDGKPGPQQDKKEKPPLSEFACKVCKKPLARRTGTSAKTGNPYDFFACSGFPKCKAAYNPKEDGTPDYDSAK